MKPPAFWQRRGLAASALLPVAALWGGHVRRRMRRSPYWPQLPVLCVGNYTNGGEGKTPTALAIGEIVRSLGLRPGFLTRGYGGNEIGPVVVDIAGSDPARVGDEALLLAAAGRTVVSADRAKGARLLADEEAEIIVMDDGFQNPGLGKDLSIIVIDAQTGLGNRWTMPAGPLRAPLKLQLALTDAVVLIGEGQRSGDLVRLAARAGKPLFHAGLVPVEPQRWKGANVFAYAGIGRPEKFFESLASAGAHFAGTNAFPDHHRFTEAEARSLLAHADAGDIRLVTTAKDYARLSGATGALADLRERTEMFEIRTEFEAAPAMTDFVRRSIETVRAGRGKRRPAGDAR